MLEVTVSSVDVACFKKGMETSQDICLLHCCLLVPTHLCFQGECTLSHMPYHVTLVIAEHLQQWQEQMKPLFIIILMDAYLKM